MTIPSLVILVGLWGGTLVQAPPVKAPQVQAPPVKEPAKESVKPVAPSMEEVIANALRSHPEILVAEAKLAGARADLELAKLTLSQKIVRAKGRLDAARQTVASADEEFKVIQARSRDGNVDGLTLYATNGKLLTSKIQFKEAEAEWKMYEPPAAAKKVDAPNYINPFGAPVIEDSLMRAMLSMSPPVAVPSLAPTDVDRERYKFLMTPLKLKKVVKVDLIQAIKFLQPQSGLKGLTLRVPNDVGTDTVKDPPLIEWDDGEMSAVSWLQLFADQFNQQQANRLPQEAVGQYDWYVREYGLTFQKVASKPIGALTLAEFLKTMRNLPNPAAQNLGEMLKRMNNSPAPKK